MYFFKSWGKTIDKCSRLAYNILYSCEQGKYRGVEQLVARRAHNPKVVGSSPSSATNEKQTSNRVSVFYLPIRFLFPISLRVMSPRPKHLASILQF